MPSEAFDHSDYVPLDHPTAGYVEFNSNNAQVDEVSGVVGIPVSLLPAAFAVAVAATSTGTIRVVNAAGDTAYSREIADGWIWFDWTADGDTATDVTWRVYAGNSDYAEPSATGTLGRVTLWSSAGYVGAWHMAEDPSGSAPQLLNSAHATAGGGTAAGTMTSGDLVAGKVGNGIAFDGLDDRFELDNTGSIFDLNVYTVEAQIRPTDVSPAFAYGIFANYISNNASPYNGFAVVLNASGQLRLFHNDANVTVLQDVVGATTLSINTDYTVGATRAGDNAGAVYLNGAADGSGSLTETANFTGAGPRIGAENASDDIKSFPGIISLLRVSSSARSADYMSTHHNNQANPGTFWTVSAWVAAPASASASDSDAGSSSDSLSETQSGEYEPIAVNQPPSNGTDYPFAKPSSDVRYLLGDLWLSYEDDTCAYALPLRVAWLAGFGSNPVANQSGRPTPSHDYDMVIEDADGVVVFDSTTADDYAEVPWGDGSRLRTLEWKTENAVLRTTAHMALPDDLLFSDYDTYIEPSSSDLSARAYSVMPRRVRSIKVGLLTFDPGDLVLQSGFNFQMTPSVISREDGRRRVSRIELAAIPGAGEGRQPGCEDPDVVIRRINDIGGDDAGNFTFDAEGCYRTQRPSIITSTSPRQATLGAATLSDEADLAALQFFNDCVPCCECDDFVRTYEGLRRVFSQYVDIGSRAEDVRDQLVLNKERWERQLACRRLNALRLVLNQGYDCRIGVGGMFCNLTQCCLGPIHLRFTFQAYDDGVIDPSVTTLQLLCDETKRAGADTGYQEISHEFSGGYPIFDTIFDYSDPQGTSMTRTRVRFGGCQNGQSVKVTLSAHAPNATDENGDPCGQVDPSEVTVPSDIQTLWASNPPVYPVRALVQKAIPLLPGTNCQC